MSNKCFHSILKFKFFKFPFIWRKTKQKSIEHYGKLFFIDDDDDPFFVICFIVPLFFWMIGVCNFISFNIRWPKNCKKKLISRVFLLKTACTCCLFFLFCLKWKEFKFLIFKSKFIKENKITKENFSFRGFFFIVFFQIKRIRGQCCCCC